MKNLKFGLLVLGLITLLAPTLSAQQSKLRKAQYFMEALQYDKAIELYHKLYKKEHSSKEVIGGLARAYQKSGQHESALDWYVEAESLTDLPADFFYYYGQCLLQKGDCENAQIKFTEFLHRKPYDTRRVILEDVCTYWDAISNTDDNLVSLDHPDFNGSGSDIAPAFFNESLVFGSVRQVLGQKNASYDLYTTKPLVNELDLEQQIEFGPVVSFSSDLNSVLNEAIITFNADCTEAYFTRNRTDLIDEKFSLRRLEILVSQQNMEGQWSEPKALLFNSPNYSCAHPALSPDGQRLFFASDRPGGFGGKDIYVCERDGFDWSTPINLGPSINTEGDELYPFYHDNGELFFASDGQLGIGGHDLFKADDLGDGAWSEVVHLGQPINSESDDFGLILSKDGSYGFFTSNREGGQGNDDIYAFRTKRVKLELNMVDGNGAPINKMVALMEKDNLTPLLTDENGHLSFWLDLDECKYLTVIDEDYYPFAADFCAGDAIDGKITANWPLQEKQVNDFADYTVNKGESIVYGTVFDQRTGQVLPNAQIQLKSTACSKSVSLNSDENGQFVYQWEEDCCFDVSFSKDGFFAQTSGKQVCKPENGQTQELSVSLAPYRLDEIKTDNTDLNNSLVNNEAIENYESIPYRLNIYYDLGRASVRSEGIQELNRLKDIMEANPALLIEVSSHTDTRGSAAFNWNLSQRRANAIVNYLIKRGISSDRLVAKGYGEQRLVNSCTDESDCSEEDHQLNRRTEFRVLEQKYGQSN